MKLAVAALSVMFGATVMNATSAQASTLYLSNTLDLAQPLPGETVVGGCAFAPIGLCTPEDSATVNTDPTRPLPLIANDTGYKITGFVYKLDPNADAIWGSASSNFFTNIYFSDNAKTVTFSGGELEIGEVVRAIRRGGSPEVSYEVSFLGEQQIFDHGGGNNGGDHGGDNGGDHGGDNGGDHGGDNGGDHGGSAGVPEPTTLVGMALAGLGGAWARRRQVG
jgi:hypothetical protein